MTDPAVMSPTEALMWAVERDPVLRSTFINITILEGSPDLDRLAVRLGGAISAFPRMRQRVRTGTLPWERPGWVDDESFDLAYHLRHVALPPPGTDRDLLDLAGQWLQDAFDPVRPLWQLIVVEGLTGGRSALVAKMHHTITDGVGGLRLSSSFLDFDAAGAHPVRLAGADPGGDGQGSPAGAPGGAGAVAAQVAGLVRTGTRVVTALRPDRLVDQAREALGTVVSLARQAGGAGGPAAPWRGLRSMGRRLETIDLDLEDARATAKALGGTVNDFFVCGVAAGAASYLRAAGSEVDRLRVAVPVSTRVDTSFGGNAFVPARVTIPLDAPDPAGRFAAAHSALAAARGERALTVVDRVAGALLALPPVLLTPLARQQVSSVDLAASNLRGSPVELFVAGARVAANYPMGPTAGVAFNATVLSYLGRLDLGLAVDTAAIERPGELRGCIEAAFAELVAAGTGGRA